MIKPYIGQSEFEDEILELIDNADTFTRSDLQALVTVLVRRIIEARPVEEERFK